MVLKSKILIYANKKRDKKVFKNFKIDSFVENQAFALRIKSNTPCLRFKF